MCLGVAILIPVYFAKQMVPCVCCVHAFQEMNAGEVNLEGLLEMSEEQVCELLQKFGANEEECARLNASLSCLRKAHQLGESWPGWHRDIQYNPDYLMSQFLQQWYDFKKKYFF